MQTGLTSRSREVRSPSIQVELHMDGNRVTRAFAKSQRTKWELAGHSVTAKG